MGVLSGGQALPSTAIIALCDMLATMGVWVCDYNDVGGGMTIMMWEVPPRVCGCVTIMMWERDYNDVGGT